jgi:hypothetical protein
VSAESSPLVQSKVGCLQGHFGREGGHRNYLWGDLPIFWWTAVRFCSHNKINANAGCRFLEKVLPLQQVQVH